MASNKIEIENSDSKTGNSEARKDPTSFLPEEPMSYEIKKKKKKKKKKQDDDPFKDIGETAYVTERIVVRDLEPEVSIKVEDIEVELDFNDFTTNEELLVLSHSDDSQEHEVKIENQNREAVLLTFESIINERSLNPTQNGANTDQVCKTCHLVFSSHRTLLIHQKRKHKLLKPSDYVCDFCGMTYDNKNSLNVHVRRKHGPNSEIDNEERTCEECALVFKGMPRLRLHMRRKHGSFQDIFKHECDHCGITYENYRSLVVHKKRKHTNVKKPVLDQWYNCPYCPKAFNKRETYTRHMQRKHDMENKPSIGEIEVCKNEAGEIVCTQCHLVFTSVNYLKLHMRRKHNALKEDFRLKCKICNMSYDKIESLKRHVRRHHNQESYCNVCQKQFGTKELYLNHSHVTIVKECSLCGLIFATQRGLAKHLRCTHKIDTPKVAFCNICNEGFHDKRQLKPHLLKVHYNISYTCRYCKKTFKTKETLRRHVMRMHSKNTSKDTTQLQKCQYCPEKFDNEFKLCKHINKSHRESVVKPEIKMELEDNEKFACTKCPERYPDWEGLKNHHKENHYTAVTLQCQVCGEIVPEIELPKHIKQQHTEPEEMQCRYCDFKTKTKVSLTQHTLRHKNVETIRCDYQNCRYTSYYAHVMEKHKKNHETQGVKLQCTQCPFQSMNKYILKYHEEAHMTGKKRYACDQCDYATTLPANLVQHKFKHSTEKRFKCEVCPFATKYNTSLRFHVKKKHCDLPS